MKTFLCLMFVLSSLSSYANTQNFNTGRSEQIRVLSEKICLQYVGDTSQVADNINKVIIGHLQELEDKFNNIGDGKKQLAPTAL
ncbi:hypothetical protein NBRC116592_03910 [Colwellia sp. KU-HH00111]|uniref:hypothetical protein n=1 Tax=Colwellia sp. KU-HH00111 TaxID=3127652 RepID=UPI003101B66C